VLLPLAQGALLVVGCGYFGSLSLFAFYTFQFSAFANDNRYVGVIIAFVLILMRAFQLPRYSVHIRTGPLTNVALDAFARLAFALSSRYWYFAICALFVVMSTVRRTGASAVSGATHNTRSPCPLMCSRWCYAPHCTVFPADVQDRCVDGVLVP